jgi:hypothetical protein
MLGGLAVGMVAVRGGEKVSATGVVWLTVAVRKR